MKKVFERKKKEQTEARDDVSLTEPDTSAGVTDIPIRGRIRLSCDIDRHNHRKLRMKAAATDKTILEVVESLIEEHCNN